MVIVEHKLLNPHTLCAMYRLAEERCLQGRVSTHIPVFRKVLPDNATLEGRLAIDVCVYDARLGTMGANDSLTQLRMR